MGAWNFGSFAITVALACYVPPSHSPPPPVNSSPLSLVFHMQSLADEVQTDLELLVTLPCQPGPTSRFISFIV